MYIVCLIFAILALVGCIGVAAMFLKNRKYIEQDALDAARRMFRAGQNDDQTAAK
ncbi:hypothetical protein [Herbaspirillum camelliae]|uniref:hypothetical protein n=1 Tax=Herbaspirillum camelliae TaxID=1892903 RepID=UPI0018E9DEE2|nr:hypothetical protein [Herbaspirillum camelliae]